MVKKIDILRDYMEKNQWGKALSLAASWASLGKHKNAIQTGHSAYTRPDFYKQIKKDPEALVKAGIQALKDRYQNQPPQA